jgi:hypothetical protein
MLPLVWVAKLSAALVLLEVSAASVVVALKVVPAEAKSEDPGHTSPRKKRRNKSYQLIFFAKDFLDLCGF